MVHCIPAQAVTETSSADVTAEELEITPSGDAPSAVELPSTDGELELAQAVEPSTLATPPTSITDLSGTQSDPYFPADPSLHASETSLGQVTSVSQLSDVQPDDWAFQAIQSLVERYGCVAGYPNGTFRPSRAMSRREAAALVNACLDNLSNRFATKEDLDALKALQDEFAAELATLRGRVDGLEARVATVEAQQFSTTTKLNGEAIFAFSGVAGDNATTGADISGRVSLNQRTRLNFITSFTGKDRLYTRLQTSNRPVNFSDGAIPGIIDNTGTLQTRDCL